MFTLFAEGTSVYSKHYKEVRMKKRNFLIILIFTFVLTACTGAVYTLPNVARADSPVVTEHLIIPEEFEIISADFDASLSAKASSAAGGPVSSTTFGRAFIKLHCRHKETKEEYLLLYEDLKNRSKPIQIIKFEKVPFNKIMK